MVTWPHVAHLIKKSAPCPVWCPYNFCRWNYIFYLSHDTKRPLNLGVMHIYGWELLAVCHHPEKHHKYSDNRRRKIFHKRHESYKCDWKNTTKNWVDWITTKREKKCHNLKYVHFEKKCPKIKKKHYFSPYGYLL